MESFEGASEVAEVAANVSMHQGAPNEITLDSGVVLKIRRVPPLLMRRAMVQVRPPKVPVTFNEDRGREIENPNDPEYLQAMSDFAEKQGMAAFGVMVICGTSLKSVPDGIPHPEDDSWLEAMEAAGSLAEENKMAEEAERIRNASTPARYLAWVQFVAVETTEDFIALRDGLTRMSGVSEADVAVAMESFRGDEAGRVDPEPDVPASPQNGHSVPSFAGRISPGD